MTSAIIDTSIFIGTENARLDPTSVPSDGALSTATIEELWLGVLRATPVDLYKRRRTYEIVTEHFEIVPVTRAIAELSAEIRADGRARGRRYGLADALIGATGRLLDLPVYTQDIGFEGMAGVDVHVV